MAKFIHETATGLSIKGTQINLEDDGTFDVPDDLVPDALAIGCASAPAPKAGKPVPQWTNDDLKAKALELGLNVDGLDRPGLIQAVTAALKPAVQA